MKFKKLFASAIAMSMVMAMSLPTFAVETDLSQNTEITGTTSAPTIKIVVPSTGTVVLNPYKMSVESGDEEVTDTIISATQYIENHSNVDIQVNAAATGTVAGNAKLATATTQGGSKPITTLSLIHI